MKTTGQPTPLDITKGEALRSHGTLNPRPERVSAVLFRGCTFFDARDLVQVKYEMLRQVSREGVPVQTAAQAYGFSRVAWYQIKARYEACGLLGLLPQPRGRRRPPKTAGAVTANQAQELCQHYERLRQHALTSAPLGDGWGLVVFLRQGMAAWMLAWAERIMPTSAGLASTTSTTSTALGLGGYDHDWIVALADLVLGQTDPGEVQHG